MSDVPIAAPPFGKLRGMRKDGHKGEQQRYRCGDCRRCWQPGGACHRPGPAVKEQTLAMYMDGSSLIAVGQVWELASSRCSNWVKRGTPYVETAAGEGTSKD